MIAPAAVIAAVAIVILAHRLRPRPARLHGGAGRPRVRGLGAIERVIRDSVGWVERARRRRRGVTPQAVADWCAALSRELRAGTTLRSALAHTQPTGLAVADRTEPLRLALARGESVTSAAERLHRAAEPGVSPARGSHHVLTAAAVIGACGREGGNAAAALDRAAASLRRRSADEQERRAHAAQARLSAHVLTFVPVAVLGLLAAVDPDVRQIATSTLGAGLVSVGLVLNATGWWWMRRIVLGAPR